jgi:hypothetical protein
LVQLNEKGLFFATTSELPIAEVGERPEIMHLKGNFIPNMSKFNPGSLNFLCEISVNDTETTQSLL